MSHAIRAKFVVQEVAITGFGATIRANVVYGGSEENDRYFEATPGGSMELEVVKKDIALESFQPGTEFYADLTPIQPDHG